MEIIYSVLRLIIVFAGAVITVCVGYGGLSMGLEDGAIKHLMLFFPLMLVTLWGARECLEQSAELAFIVLYCGVYIALSVGLNWLVGGPVAWLNVV